MLYHDRMGYPRYGLPLVIAHGGKQCSSRNKQHSLPLPGAQLLQYISGEDGRRAATARSARVGILFLVFKYLYTAVHMICRYIHIVHAQKILKYRLADLAEITGYYPVVVCGLYSKVLKILIYNGSRRWCHARSHVEGILHTIVHYLPCGYALDTHIRLSV